MRSKQPATKTLMRCSGTPVFFQVCFVRCLSMECCFAGVYSREMIQFKGAAQATGAHHAKNVRSFAKNVLGSTRVRTNACGHKYLLGRSALG